MWIGRVNGAAREYGTNYSTFQHNLSVSEIEINRKVLSELAIHEPKYAFFFFFFLRNMSSLSLLSTDFNPGPPPC